MLSKQEHIEYWKSTANRDWKFVQQTFKIKQYVYALFFAHLVLEKLCKANWVKDNTGNHPPKIHNLIRLTEQTKLKFSQEELQFLNEMNQFQLEGRYPDYEQKLYSIYKAPNSKIILEKVTHLRKCLLEKLP